VKHRIVVAATLLGIASVVNATSSRPAADFAALPLVEMTPAVTNKPANPKDVFAVMLSGDGGWAGLDRGVAERLQARGIGVVGWDSLRYFWAERTPDAAAQDLDRVIRHYARAWNRSRVLLIGYSQGADVLPFMVNRLPAATRALVAASALVAVGADASFRVTVGNWIGVRPAGRPVAPELDDTRLGRAVCVYGADDKDAGCPRFTTPALRKIVLPGGHHFDGDYGRVADAVLSALP
jgi:Type IV secretory pathway, VirJ component